MHHCENIVKAVKHDLSVFHNSFYDHVRLLDCRSGKAFDVNVSKIL